MGCSRIAQELGLLCPVQTHPPEHMFDVRVMERAGFQAAWISRARAQSFGRFRQLASLSGSPAGCVLLPQCNRFSPKLDTFKVQLDRELGHLV